MARTAEEFRRDMDRVADERTEVEMLREWEAELLSEADAKLRRGLVMMANRFGANYDQTVRLIDAILRELEGEK